ncbi:MAG TPA: 3-keto-5-aminohexanoate cleavage protein [Deltaproteobacteria bacterium]|nr:3-keto-5-aminohexanoate cleavage protein [Deltaproteobacteria bacterium]
MSSSSTKNPAVITCAIVGAELTREQTPYLPLTPEEIAASAVGAWEAGAAIVHLHVRDAEGKPSCSREVFVEVIEKIRSRCDVIIQVSTGAALHDTYEDRFQVLETKPEMASLTTGSVNFGDEIFLNPRPFVATLAKAMQERNIKPEIEVFDAAMLEAGIHLADRGLISRPLHFDFVLGVPGALAATERNLDFLISGLPQDSTWSVAAIGRRQFPIAGLALRKGGWVRVGMEDNIYLEKGVLAKSNAELVTQAVRLAKEAGREIANSAQTREMLGLR